MAFRGVRATGAVLAVVIGALLATALPAVAHNELKSSDPQKGATLSTAPAAVVLTFAEALTPGATTITVTGPDGVSAAAGPAQLNGPVATVPLKPPMAGAYTVAYRIIADDGDVTDTNFAFTLTAAAIPAPATTSTAPTTTTATSTTATTATTATTTSPEPSQAGPTAAATTNSGTTWWPWVVGALALVLIVVAVPLLRRRRAGRTGTPSA